MMFIPRKWIPFIKKEKELPPIQKSATVPSQSIQPSQTIKNSNPILSSIKDELKTEWKGLLKMLHIYDYDKEEAYLKAYRKLRGWE